MGDDTGLIVDGVTVRYGGLVAIDRVSLHARIGTVTGLVGPNGAGKTTLFNACSGMVKPSAGSVSFLGRDITDASPSARGRVGLGRTFQHMELWDRMTVAENVAIGREARTAGTRLLGPVFATRNERLDISARSEAAIRRCDLSGLAGRRAGSLSTGQRRLVELARAIASGFELLLLDEPSSGLDARETQQFGSILRSLVSEDGTGILLVEHDMSLVRAVCDQVYVLDFGTIIEVGPTAQVLASDAVRAAYLGSDVA